MDKSEAMNRLTELLNEAAVLAQEAFNDGDIYNYGRAYEYGLAHRLGHVICDTRSGSDGHSIDGLETYEYKTAGFKGYNKNGELKTHTFNYFGFSRFEDYDTQVAYVTEKILKDAAHFWGIKTKVGFGFEAVFRIEAKDVLAAFLEALPRVWKSKNKDPRINIGLTLKHLNGKYKRVV